MKERVFLVDGMSNIYRAYYAIRGLSNKKGFPTNAIYGFTNMLRKLIQDEQPDYIGVAMDLPGRTVRHEQYEAYKATRKPMPDDLAVQIPYVLQICAALRIPVLAYESYEADDVIGTLARKAVARGCTAVIVTIDKDMLQLVDDDIRVLDGRDYTYFDRARVLEKMGIPPEKVTHFLGLCGDSSDNIPGAPGIGEKGARQLIQQYGTIENLLDHAGEIPRRNTRESLLHNRDLILTSQKLATIHTTLPIELNLEELQLKPPDTAAAMELFSEMEFTNLLKEYAPAPSEPSEMAADYGVLTSLEQLQQVLEAARSRKQAALSLLFNCENYLDSSIFGLAIALEPHHARALTPPQIHAWRDPLRAFLADSAVVKVLHNVKPALLALANDDLALRLPYYDTMLAAY
ncbi:MAG: DNA polymerase I, partial [Acidobacteria bacterium]|nr:DNA polymerase I [Acidobacteriota bacterium]